MKRKPAQLRRRSKPSIGGRVRTFWVLGILLACGAAYGLWTFAHSSIFQVRHLEISGNSRVDRAEVASRAAIGRRDNIWLLDARAAERRVETIPYVLTARVHRSLPAGIRIEVTERKPNGCVRGPDGVALTIDAAARVLEEGCLPGAVVYLPHVIAETAPGRFLHDPELTQLQRDARVLADSGERLRDFRHDKYGQLEASLSDGIRVRFGDEEDLDRKRRLIGPILASLGARIAGVTAIDLRAPSTPVVERK